MSGGIQWSLLSDLGKNFVNAYDKAQDNEVARQRLALLDEHEKLRLGIELRKVARDEASARVWDQIGAGIAGGNLGPPAPGAAGAAPGSTGAGADAGPSGPRLPTFAQGQNVGNYGLAIQGNESGGNYQAIGPTHPRYGRALGAYQVMEANIPQWSREALGREVSSNEFLANPQIQDQIFNHRFGGYVQRFGSPERAAAAWFSGSPDVTSGARDSLGTSVPSYVSKFAANYRRLQGSNRAAPDLPATEVALPADLGGPLQTAALDTGGSVPLPPTRPDETPAAPAPAPVVGSRPRLGLEAQAVEGATPPLTRVASAAGAVPVRTATDAQTPAQAPGQTPAQMLTQQQAQRDSARMRPTGVTANPDDNTTRGLIGLMVRDPSTRAAGLQLWKEMRSGEKYQVIDTPQGKAFVDPRNPGGQPIVIPNTAPDPKPDPQIEAAGKLRNEFDKHQVVKDFQDAHAGYERVAWALRNRMETGAPSAAADIAMIFGYMKLLDPGSTVREGEAASVERARGVPEHIIGLYNRLRTGERLTDDQRADFLNASLQQYQAQRNKVEGQARRYRKLAERQGLDPDEVVYLPETTTVAAPPVRQPAAEPANQGGGWADMGGGYRIREKR